MYFFPNPHKDEFLYSVLARYCVQSGNLSSIRNFDDIFGSRNILASVELPGNLDIIISNLPFNSKYTSDYFIYNNTLFPYIASFLPEARAREVKGLMKDGQASLIYNKSGYISGSINQNRNFRFCPECMREDLKNYGEMYWHRIHQITEVYVCSKHKLALCESKTPMRGNNRQSFIPATTDVCYMGKIPSYSDNIFEKLLWIAEDVQIILNSTFVFQSIENHKYLYIEELIKKKFANLNTMVHQKKLRKAILEFWGSEILQLLQCPIYVEKECYWLDSLVRNNAIPSQPIRNLILMRFLGIEPNKLLGNKIDINGNKNHKKIWEDKLKRLIKMKISIRQMAIELNSTPKTIKRYIDKLGVEPYWVDTGGRRYSIEYKDTKEFKDRQERARKEWIQFQNENPKLSRNNIKKLNETLYTWLTRYDKEWLDSNSPNIRNYKLIDWEKRDKELLPEVKKIIENMKYGKPERISWTIIGGKLGDCGLFFKNKDKLPGVKEYIETNIETLQEFQLRKMIWAIDELERENKSITKWNLIEKSGVKIRYIKNIYGDISQILKIKGYDEKLML